MSLEGLERLDVWRKAQEYAVVIYRQVLPILPSEEKWAMAQQLRRAAQSIPANIAEGYGRYYYQENIRFCYIARDSLEETISFLSLANELGYLPKELFEEIIQLSDDLTRLINGYISYLKKSKHGEREPGSPSTLREPLGKYEVVDMETPSESRISNNE